MIQRKVSFFFFIFLCAIESHCQNAPVSWSFDAERVAQSEWVVCISAALRPGWRIYSQYLAEGGPIPTTIRLLQTDDYLPMGKSSEEGKPVHFYDSLYEMEITWYEERVTFNQRIRLNHGAPSFQGTIDYMACSEHVCIPQRREFSVPLDTTQDKP